MVELQGELELADPEIVFEYFEWDLNEYAPYQLNENDFAITKQGNGFMIDIDNHCLKYSPTGEDQYEMAFMSVDNWTAENLVRWLDKQLRDSYFSQATMVKWLSDVVNYLIDHRGLKLAELMLAKYALANKLKAKIQTAYLNARLKSYQISLFAPQARVELNFDNGFDFFDNMYEDVLCYRGRYKFSKHYLGANNVPNFDGGVDGEEFQCAKAIDSNPNVKYWIRNVAKHPNSFWLPTSTDKFYPDFVAMLKDGRILVVEYKVNYNMNLSNLKPAAGSVKTRKRIGRGPGSGLGGTSTRGHKGAKSRSGYKKKIGFEGGQMPLQRRVPKFGFKNINRVAYKAINLDTIQKLAEEKNLQAVRIDDLVAAGFVSPNQLVKVLGNGTLTAKLDVQAHAFSKTAAAAIEAAGGQVVKL